MTANDNTQPVFTVSDLAKRWRCDRHVVLEAIHARRLAAWKFGKRAFRIGLDDVLAYEAWLRAQTHAALSG